VQFPFGDAHPKELMIEMKSPRAMWRQQVSRIVWQKTFNFIIAGFLRTFLVSSPSLPLGSSSSKKTRPGEQTGATSPVMPNMKQATSPLLAITSKFFKET
jgi:hypothetical protein